MKNNTKIAIGVVVAMIFGYAVGSSGSEPPTTEPTEPTEVVEQPTEEVAEVTEPTKEVVKEVQKPKNDNKFVQGDDFSIEIDDVDVKSKEMVIKYKYNNESEEDQTPMAKVSFRCYQDGVELDTGYHHSNFKDQDNILGGYSNEGLKEAKELNGDSVVVIRVEPWVSFDDEIFAEFEFNPETGELNRIK